VLPLYSMYCLCPRLCNSVADRLATYGVCVVNPGSCIFMNQVPEVVLELVSGDKPSASE
jgi:hypothetical protein